MEKALQLENCKLGNEQYGRFISSYIKAQKRPFTLNINGTWGIGKTHFLRQLYTQLRYIDEAPVVYINAWESDFSKDPLLVIVSEITSQLVAQHEGYSAHEYEQKVTETVKKLWNSMLEIGSCAAALSGLGPIYTPAKDLLTANTASDKEHSLQSLYPRQRGAVKSLKAFLSEYAEVINKKQIVVIVDELDRCRPNYAIELLETIKHFFEMPGYMFVVATDTEQLGHSIKAIYGADFNGQEYLSRFFNRSAKLPEPDKFTFSKYLVDSSQIAQSTAAQARERNSL